MRAVVTSPREQRAGPALLRLLVPGAVARPASAPRPRRVRHSRRPGRTLKRKGPLMPLLKIRRSADRRHGLGVEERRFALGTRSLADLVAPAVLEVARDHVRLDYQYAR